MLFYTCLFYIRRGGIGLGLALTGQGSVFRCELPAELIVPKERVELHI